MKICIFSRPFYPAVGGLEEVAKTLAYEFSSMNCSVEVVTDVQGSAREDKRFPFSITRTSMLRDRYLAFRRADVVLFMNFTFAGVPIALLARRPIVLSHHGIYQYKGSFKKQIVEFSKKQLTRFFINICVSQFVARNLPAESIVIPNAFNNRIFYFQYVKRVSDFVFCGRMVTEKGADVLLDAFKIVLNAYPKATLTMIGDGPQKIVLQEQAKFIGVSKRVIFTGILRNEELASKLREHSCMVIPSVCEEAFGIVALEGIASCDTVISSNRGGLSEAVGDCGILVGPTVEALAKAMLSVLQSKENGTPLPGQPTEDRRAAHLAKHSPMYLAQSYVNVCRIAIHR